VSKFRFWATIITAFVLGLIGFWLGGTLPFPSPVTEFQSRIFYALIGLLITLISFARISSWVIKTTTRLLMQFVSRIAIEVTRQFTQLSSRGWRPSSSSSGTRIRSSRPIILDTSGIIDGRVLDVAKTGFLIGTVVVPEFVMSELREVADSAEAVKRARGRFGFDVIARLKKVEGIKIEVWDEDVAGKTVDDKLIRLSKNLHGRLLTCDYNLNQNAQAAGVRALNLNELANSLKTLPVPGEKLSLKIITPGKESDQGVGYLQDGTMVIAKEGAAVIGQEVVVEVNKIIQGPAGRIIFGKVNSHD